MFRPFIKEEIGKPDCNDLPGFCGTWYDNVLDNVTIKSLNDLMEFLYGYFGSVEREDLDKFIDLLLKVAWFKVNYYDEYVRVSKLGWFRIGIHNSYILDIIPSDKKEAAIKLLEDDPDEDIYLKLNENILNKYIRNQEIREYFMCLRFSIADLVQIVDKAYIDIETKLETFKWMEQMLEVPKDAYKMCTGWEKERFREARFDDTNSQYMYLQLSRIIYQKVSDFLHDKHNGIIFMAIEQQSKSRECPEREEYDFTYRDPNAELFNSMRSLIKWVDDSYIFDDCDYLGYYIAVYSIGSETPMKIMDCCMELVDDNLVIYSFYLNSSYYNGDMKLDDEISKQLDISREMLMFWKEELSDSHWELEGLKLPYDYGDVIKIQTPIMEEPDFAVYKPDMDGNDRWYNWLSYNEKEEADVITDLAYHELNIANVYVTWDWIEKVENAST